MQSSIARQQPAHHAIISTTLRRLRCQCSHASPRIARRRFLSTSAKSHVDFLSKIYAPTSRINKQQGDATTLKSLQYLLKGGFIRQSSAGIYSLLPLGQRVIDKLSKIIEDEMHAVGASKVTLPHLLQPDLWEKSGRWESSGPELYRLKDRRESDMLLAPTHEEEIAALVAADAPSERNLPVRLFQIGRKFRDEARPRAGLLRGREFLMKDLYTFDASEELAEATYNQVKEAYKRIFDRIGLPYLVAEADTGNIGGSSSHEFHYQSPVGEDTLLTCSSCNYVANSELAKSAAAPPPEMLNELDVQCGNKLEATSCIEVAHTFLLGTKYSQALDVTFARTHQAKQSKEYYQMGCYGIGVTRLLGSVAELKCDDKGLRWPESMTPYKVCVIVLDNKNLEEAKAMISNIDADAVIDDRFDQSFGKRIRDAELIGYPYVAVLGRDWENNKQVELHDRETGQTTSLSEADLRRQLQSSQV
ncbi:class II aaRS and biotin synthetase [Cystobasidium minutum MCA 4210]|uniref:class II aaRS and biotin synthetase n=1 Tax=Cystobasidium minutum MCA 4210 TaxID=1397322 RepID=UPI0034CD1497|eukprot:jgi/Rhomi1/142808/e_gw1.3.180.1